METGSKRKTFRKIEYIKADERLISSNLPKRTISANDHTKDAKIAKKELFDARVVVRYRKWCAMAPVGPGFFNDGNSCYLNSTLQCLMHTPALVQILTKEKELVMRLLRKRENQPKTILENFMGLVSDVWSTKSRGTISPRCMTSTIRRVGRQFKPLRQEDAHEYLRQLLDTMHEEILKNNGVKVSDGAIAESTLVSRVFGGNLCNTVTCPLCGYASKTFNHFQDLSLDVSQGIGSVQAALQAFTRPEHLSKGNEWKCDKCQRRVRATKQMTLELLPQVLVLQLKRFSFGSMMGKITKQIKFSPTLDVPIGAHSRPSAPPNGASSGSKGQSSTHFKDDKKGFGEKQASLSHLGGGEHSGASSAQTHAHAQYSLYGIVVHHGHSTRSGHYVAYVKAPNDTWYEMNDSRVSQVSHKTVLEKQAYILFYNRVLKHVDANTNTDLSIDKSFAPPVSISKPIKNPSASVPLSDAASAAAKARSASTQCASSASAVAMAEVSKSNPAALSPGASSSADASQSLGLQGERERAQDLKLAANEITSSRPADDLQHSAKAKRDTLVAATKDRVSKAVSMQSPNGGNLASSLSSSCSESDARDSPTTGEKRRAPVSLSTTKATSTAAGAEDSSRAEKRSRTQMTEEAFFEEQEASSSSHLLDSPDITSLSLLALPPATRISRRGKMCFPMRWTGHVQKLSKWPSFGKQPLRSVPASTSASITTYSSINPSPNFSTNTTSSTVTASTAAAAHSTSSVLPMKSNGNKIQTPNGIHSFHLHSETSPPPPPATTAATATATTSAVARAWSKVHSKADIKRITPTLLAPGAGGSLASSPVDLVHPLASNPLGPASSGMSTQTTTGGVREAKEMEQEAKRAKKREKKKEKKERNKKEREEKGKLRSQRPEQEGPTSALKSEPSVSLLVSKAELPQERYPDSPTLSAPARRENEKPQPDGVVSVSVVASDSVSSRSKKTDVSLEPKSLVVGRKEDQQEQEQQPQQQLHKSQHSAVRQISEASVSELDSYSGTEPLRAESVVVKANGSKDGKKLEKAPTVLRQILAKSSRSFGDISQEGVWDTVDPALASSRSEAIEQERKLKRKAQKALHSESWNDALDRGRVKKVKLKGDALLAAQAETQAQRQQVSLARGSAAGSHRFGGKPQGRKPFQKNMGKGGSGQKYPSK